MALACRNRRGRRFTPGQHRLALSVSEHAHGRSFHTGMIGTLQVKEPWRSVVVASAALGLALYYLNVYTQHSTTQGDEKLSQVSEPTCQDDEADRAVNAMNPEERACHERFMREAIAMVCSALHSHYFTIIHQARTPSTMPQLTHHV